MLIPIFYDRRYRTQESAIMTKQRSFIFKSILFSNDRWCYCEEKSVTILYGKVEQTLSVPIYIDYAFFDY